MQEAVGFIEETGRRHGVEHPIQMTVATTDGESIWAFRYSSEGDSRSLYFSTDVRTLKMLYPDDVRLQMMGDEGRLVVSGPLGPRRGLERGAGVELRHRQAWPGRDAPVHADSVAQ